MSKEHWAIFITNNSNKAKFIREILAGTHSDLSFLNDLNGVLFSKLTVEQLIDKEDRHGIKILTHSIEQPLKSMSSGEQKKVLLNHLLDKNPDFMVLDNPFDNLDAGSQEELIKTLENRSEQTIFIQIISRKKDLLPFISNLASLNKEHLSYHQNLATIFPCKEATSFIGKIPSAPHPFEFQQDLLIELKNVSVRFGNKTILQNINWTIKKGEFWQLIGKNGSGKTTILSMITGDNAKGYGQELFLFGRKKGSGESIWDIKKKIGYFTPAMTDTFSGHHTIENMLISGLTDSIGLYVKPTEIQLRLAKEWLQLINMWALKEVHFHSLSMGQKRLVMVTRAMIKHPLLFILDEPTAGLDDTSAKLLVELVNKIARESDTTTLFVSHREEPELQPDFVYELKMSENGSIGRVISGI